MSDTDTTTPTNTHATIAIAQAPSKFGPWVTNRQYTWIEFLRRAKRVQPVGSRKRTSDRVIDVPYKLKQYHEFDADKRAEIKDVGCYLFGRMDSTGKRSPSNVLTRSAVVLDIDKSKLDWVQLVMEIVSGLKGPHLGNCEWLMVPSLSHRAKPVETCARIVIPLAKPVSAEWYEPLCRIIMDAIGIELFDTTAAQVNRMFYLPAKCVDAPWPVEHRQGDNQGGSENWLDAYALIREFFAGDATRASDPAQWPKQAHGDNPGSGNSDKCPVEELNPVMQAVCQHFSIREVVENDLSEHWRASEMTDRYSWVEGSSSNGGRIHDDWLFYSEHDSDPYHHTNWNAFEAVQMYLFGHLDDDQDVWPVSKRKASYDAAVEHFMGGPDGRALQEQVTQINGVKAKAEAEFIAESAAGFEPVPKPNVSILARACGNDVKPHERARSFFDGAEADYPRSSLNTYAKIMAPKRTPVVCDKDGQIKSTLANHKLLLANKHELYPALAYNEMRQQAVWVRSIDQPWLQVTVQDELNGEPVTEMQADKVATHLMTSAQFNSVNTGHVLTALESLATRNPYNPIARYLRAQVWDGVPRVANVFSEFMGVVDNVYTRGCSDLFFRALVGRALEPGIKIDNMVVLEGLEGVGKSTFCKALMPYGHWFTDNVGSPQGSDTRDTAMSMQGRWLGEVAELMSLKTASPDTIKVLLSLTEDTYRAPYARLMETRKRGWLLIGTTNKGEYLASRHGNRRVLPLKSELTSFFDARGLEAIRDQLWAEAVVLFKADSKLTLSDEATALARGEQRQRQYIDESMVDAIKEYVGGYDEAEPTVREVGDERPEPKDAVCLKELMSALYGIAGAPKSSTEKKIAHDLKHHMDTFLSDWERPKQVVNSKGWLEYEHEYFSGYGSQRVWWKRVKTGAKGPAKIIDFEGQKK